MCAYFDSVRGYFVVRACLFLHFYRLLKVSYVREYLWSSCKVEKVIGWNRNASSVVDEKQSGESVNMGRASPSERR